MHALSAPVLLYPVANKNKMTIETSDNLQSESLTEAAKLASMGLVVKNLGHEINSPVSVLMAKLEDLFEKTSAQTLTEEFLKTELQKLLSATQRLGKVTKSLRALSYEPGQESTSKFFLNQALQQALNLNHEKMSRYGIHLSQSVDPNLIVEGRLGDLTHAFFNLISESIEALSRTAGPSIQIEARRTDSGIRIEIKDNRALAETTKRTAIPKPILEAKELSSSAEHIKLAVAAEIFQGHHGRFYSDYQLTEHCYVLEMPSFKLLESHRGARSCESGL